MPRQRRRLPPTNEELRVSWKQNVPTNSQEPLQRHQCMCVVEMELAQQLLVDPGVSESKRNAVGASFLDAKLVAAEGQQHSLAKLAEWPD